METLQLSCEYYYLFVKSSLTAAAICREKEGSEEW